MTALPHHVPLAAQTRGERVESLHYGSAVVLSGDSATVYGDAETPFYPRSALKPLFAVGMLRAGLDLTDEQIALTAASHSGSEEHQRVALSTLATAGLGPEHLGNSIDLPYGTAERAAWLAAGHGPTQLAQNCSGKHSALVALCRLHGWPVEGYLSQNHPVYRLLTDTVIELTGETPAHISTDGCGTPVHALTLPALARGFARLAAADADTPEGRVAAAMRAHPELVAGEGRDVTTVMRTLDGAVAKDGFEGIQALALADGTAVALKIADGADRARMPITLALLAEHPTPVAHQLDSPALTDVLAPPAFGGGQIVGRLRALPRTARTVRH
ncbi:asparaginase [Citricoccus sp. NR2]|uniref:asparaginase n=1 Tax=Citricoccus sp. NR2 TaxID=3004095 RepID=UPI0022DD4C5E|nr:asparaginase [Citricoccus sp. NR2]WBL20430.1 asparaginase [Citricoccus sp. NR2]